MNPEIALYASELERILDKLCASVQGLSEAQLNWRPPAPDANSIFVIATHLLGNAESWVLGIACGQPITRDRAAEFRAAGADAAPLVARARELWGRLQPALAALPPETLGDMRPSPQSLWGAGRAEPVTGRQALVHVIEHASNHLGHIDVTRDLALAQAS